MAAVSEADAIRDADLKAELAKVPAGSLFYDTMVRSLAATQRKRDDETARLAALPPAKRRRAMLADRLLAVPPELPDLAHIHSVIAICGMPYERLPEGQHHYARTQGNMGIDIVAGTLRDPNGTPVIQPVPFGPKARLVMMHLCSEAIRQKSPTIEISDSFTGFVRDMGFSNSGGARGPLTAFREQLNALAASTFRISVWNGSGVRTNAITPIQNFNLWLSPDPNQRSLWPSTVTFSPAMYQSLSKHALPLNRHVLRALAGSARKLDIYAWLTWRMSNLEKPLSLSWKALYEQFGGQNANPRDFKRHFKSDLAEITEVLTKLPATLSETGLTIKPADPALLALPVRRIPSNQ